MPNPEIFNLNFLPPELISEFDQELATAEIGRNAGSKKLYVNIDRVQPGFISCKFHHHSRQEEFFIILNGSGRLRLNNELREIKKGDFFAKPAGLGIAHQFINSGHEVLEILDIGTMEDEDIVFYPDENSELHKPGRRVFRNGQELQNWSSDPNTADESQIKV
jgi:uncharacterized cupin superfamily protein